MLIYMDRHNTEGLTREDIVASHVKDFVIQGRYGVRFMTYWHDEVTKAFCLVDAPNKDAIQKVHDEAYGGIANEIIEVDPAVVEAFLGRVTDPPPLDAGGPAYLDSASRAIHVHRSARLDWHDRPTWRREGHGIIAYTRFSNTKGVARTHGARGQALRRWDHGVVCFYRPVCGECAIAIQRAFAAYNVQNSGAPLHLRIGLGVGEPVEHDNDLFGRTVQLAFRLCTHAKPDQMLATEEVVAQSAGKTSLFLSRGPISPKGFDQPIQIYELRWC